MRRKVLVIGLDGASFVALDPLLERGAMPALARLIKSGFAAPLLSTLPPVSAPAWSSFITGKNPGKHGVYQFYDVNPLSPGSLGRGNQTYLAVPGVVVNARSITEPTLWDLISAAGLRMATINVPMTYPPMPLNGIMVTGMLTPPGSRHFTYPAELADELHDYEIDLNPKEKDYSSADDVFLQRMNELLDKRGRAALSLFQKEPWDCFIIIFTETDRLQHRCWHLLDPVWSARLTPQQRSIQPQVIGFYTKLDQYLAEFVQLAGNDYEIIILSDHGFGPAATKRLNYSALADWLGLSLRADGVELTRTLKKFLPSKRKVYKYLGPLMSDDVLKQAEERFRAAALSGVKAKLIKLHDYIGGVWINTKTHPNGVIELGAEHENFRREIVEKLSTLRDPTTSKPIVSSIHFREDLYQGKHAATAPDVVFVLDAEYGIETDIRSSEMICEVPQKNQGTHRAEGILILSGKTVKAAGRVPATPRLEDVTATMLYLLGVPLLDDMDGRVIEEALGDAFLGQRAIAVCTADSVTKPDRSSHIWDSATDEEQIRERLQELGYLE
jgi:predicted AlkP superfamily phosphohydrolase/phosphomutase